MLKEFSFYCLVLVVCVKCHPTMYKFNENKKLEPDLVPVSSTVIPLPVYQVGYGVGVAPLKDEKVKKPEGPISLITVHTKKKPIVQIGKLKQADVSSVKQVNKRDFDN